MDPVKYNFAMLTGLQRAPYTNAFQDPKQRDDPHWGVIAIHNFRRCSDGPEAGSSTYYRSIPAK